jgi:16S rRNA (guanine(527)-N(7))-methyltransferase RsmG
VKTAEALRRFLKASQIPVESETGRQLADYLALLEKWNARINLTSSTDWRVIGPMFREGIWAGKLYPAAVSSHLDIGSGAGFPALLLKILNPRMELELIESRERKSHFLETVAHQLGLVGVIVHGVRLSEFLRQCGRDRHWDCVSWKAIKLSSEDLLRLHAHGRHSTQFWMFHGREPAWEAARDVQQRFALARQEKVPGMKEWNLSIYRAV